MMTKYKSLLFREWKLSSRHYIIRSVLMMLFVGFIAIAMLVVGSTGAAEAEGGLTLSDFADMMSYFIALIAAVVVSEDSGVFKADINSKWLRYSYALPVTAFEKAVVRYIIKIIAIIVGMGVAILSTAVLCSIAGSSVSGSMILNFFLMLDVFLLYDIIVQAFVLRARNMDELKKVRTIASAVAFGIIFIVPEFIPDDKLDSLLESDSLTMAEVSEIMTIPDKIGLLAIPVLIAVLVIGFVLTWKSLERREG